MDDSCFGKFHITHRKFPRGNVPNCYMYILKQLHVPLSLREGVSLAEVPDKQVSTLVHTGQQTGGARGKRHVQHRTGEPLEEGAAVVVTMDESHDVATPPLQQVGYVVGVGGNHGAWVEWQLPVLVGHGGHLDLGRRSRERGEQRERGKGEREREEVKQFFDSFELGNTASIADSQKQSLFRIYFHLHSCI